MSNLNLPPFSITTDLNRYVDKKLITRYFRLVLDLGKLNQNDKLEDYYNVNKMVAYFCYGNTLLGGYCKTLHNFPSGRHWVERTNKYAIFEIPEKTNHSKRKSEGGFFVLAYNIDYDYFVALYLDDYYQTAAETGGYAEQKAEFEVLGCFEFQYVPDHHDRLSILCIHSSADSDHDNFDSGFMFDMYHLREINGYHMSKLGKTYNGGHQSQKYWHKNSTFTKNHPTSRAWKPWHNKPSHNSSNHRRRRH
jgi:hypothetical protein